MNVEATADVAIGETPDIHQELAPGDDVPAVAHQCPQDGELPGRQRNVLIADAY
ncbi:MAG TPA: hypothetical protein VME66_14030 [Candidatus Acidoferrales bacterium]|nr:hypothetical protein [Candidatus Acidoferrales bacterium]